MTYFELPHVDRMTVLLFTLDCALAEEVRRESQVREVEYSDMELESVVSKIRALFMSGLGPDDFDFLTQYYGSNKTTRHILEMLGYRLDDNTGGMEIVDGKPPIPFGPLSASPDRLCEMHVSDVERVVFTLYLNSLIELKNIFQIEVLKREPNPIASHESASQLIAKHIKNVLGPDILNYFLSAFARKSTDTPAYEIYLNKKFQQAVDGEVCK